MKKELYSLEPIFWANFNPNIVYWLVGVEFSVIYLSMKHWSGNLKLVEFSLISIYFHSDSEISRQSRNIQHGWPHY